MKSKGVEVDVTSQRHDRAAGDAPSIGKVAKMEGKDTAPQALPQRRIRHEWKDESDSNHPLVKVAMVAVLLLGLLVAAGMIYTTVKRKLNPGPGAPTSSSSASAASSRSDDTVDENMLTDQEALDLVRRGLAIRMASRVTDCFHYTDSLDPVWAVGFLKDYTARDGLVTRMECLDPLEENGVTTVRVRVHSTLSGEPHIRDAYLTQDAKGVWKIDFDSFVSQHHPSHEFEEVREPEDTDENE